MEMFVSVIVVMTVVLMMQSTVVRLTIDRHHQAYVTFFVEMTDQFLVVGYETR